MAVTNPDDTNAHLESNPSVFSNNKYLSLYYQNVQGLNSLTNVILNSSSACEYDIVALTETWVQDGVYNSELFPARYTVFRKDRDLKRTQLKKGGGSLLAINNRIASTKLDLDNIGFESIPLVDVIGSKIVLDFSFVYVILFYIPPNLEIRCYETIFEILSSIEFLSNSNFIILGDFNLREYAAYVQQGLSCNRLQPFLNFVNFMDITQHNYVYNSENKLLDLILSNTTCTVEHAQNILVREIPIHPALVCFYKYASKSKKNKHTEMNIFYNFRKANFIGLYDHLCEINWDFLDNMKDPEEACDAFYTKLYDSLDNFVPKTRQNRRSYPPWFSSDIIYSIKKKYKLWQNYKRNRDPTVLVSFQNLRSRIKNDIDNEFKAYCSRLQNDIVHNPSAFWKFVKTKKSSTALPNAMVDCAGEIVQHPEGIAESFSQFFKESFTVSNNNNANASGQTRDHGFTSDSFRMPELSEPYVFNCLKKIKPKGTVGPDKIPAFLLNDCAPVLASPLCKIFNLCIVTSKFPNVWKISKITPVFKKGEVNKIENYRPVAIINNFSKVFEIAINEHLSFYLKNKISPLQHGFIKGRSTVTNLTCITQYITDAFDECLQVDVVYTDFSKAFDRLDHKMLLHKLDLVGLSVSVVSLFASYLEGRTQYVECSGRASREVMVKSGVPQGSILGPSLFVLFINDIVNGLGVEALLYADDLKLYTKVEDQNSCLKLQKALDTLCNWCNMNNLPLNPSKCNVMSFTVKKNKIVVDYTIGGQTLNRPEVFKDLGVTFDPTMSFVNHITNVVNKSYKLLGFIVRNTREFTNADLIKLLYFAFVRSVLEYGAIVWNPHYNVHVNHLESVQRRLLKYLSFKLDGVYPQMGFSHNDLLTRHRVDALQDRRIKSQIIFLSQLLQGNIDCPSFLEKIKFLVPRAESRNPPTFYLPTPRINVNKYSPLHDLCNNYNKINSKLDVFNCSVAQIKKLIL